MSVNNLVNKQVFNGDDLSSEFEVTDFKTYLATEIAVSVKNTTAGALAGLAAGETADLVYATDFTVALDGTAPAYCTVTVIDSSFAPLPTGIQLIVKRVVSPTQLVSLKDNEGTPAKVFEEAFDRAVMLAQQILETISRAIVLDEFSTLTELKVPDPEANKYLRWNADEDALENAALEVTETEYPGAITFGADASKPASPTSGDIYFATDTNKFYKCVTGGTWTTAMVLADLFELAKGANISSATPNLATATANFVHITGTTTITAFGTAQAGAIRFVTFDGSLTLTHNATSLILPGGSNIQTAAGDCGIFISEGSGNWRCLAYQRSGGFAKSPRAKYSNLVVVRNSATQCTITADDLVLYDSVNNPTTIHSVNEAIAITTSGAGGRVASVTEAANKIYYLWIARKSSDGTVNGFLSETDSYSTMFGLVDSGYDQLALICPVGNDGSSNFLDFKLVGDRYEFLPSKVIASGTQTTSWAAGAVDLTPSTLTYFVPTNLSKTAFGIVGGTAGVWVTNDSANASFDDAFSANKIGQADITGSPVWSKYWELGILTTDTLYYRSGGSGGALHLLGFYLDKM